ncbi:MAG: hypothetical protein PHN38_09295 [Sulfurospirillaceae bacterium]|nr:hypothetical protein [Sulfurospirillaceae bacterium]
MTESIIVHDISELEKYQTMIKSNLEMGIENLKKIIEENAALEIFKMLKFEKVSVEPLNGEKENIIEVINQSMTYIVSLMAVEYLLNLFPQKAFKINWGNIAGYDIESLDEEIICECFAATSYKSNAKLTADLKRLEEMILP